MRETIQKSLAAIGFALLAAPATAQDKVNYQDHIRPIFQQSCFNCHNADDAKGGLDLTSFRATLAGGSSGDIVVSQSADASTLLGVMAHTLEPKMPPRGGKVSDNKLKLVKQWIDEGLRETATSSANKPKKPRVDLSVGKAAVGRPDGPPIMPTDMPLGPIHHTPRPGTIVDIAGHPWSPIVATTGQRQVLIHHTETGELLGVLPFACGQPQTLRFSWTGKLLMVGGGVAGASGTVVLYDVQNGAEVSRVGEEVDAVLAADLDPTQRFVALGGPSKRVKGYDVATGELVYNLDKHTEWVTAIAFSPNGDYLASGDRNGGLHIWEADTGMHVYRLDGHGKAVTALAWRYDGKVLASSGEDGQARLWEMKTGKQVKNWGAHNNGAMSIAFAEDGRLVTTGRDQLVRVWDAKGSKKHEVKAMDSIGLAASFDTSAMSVIAGDLAGKLVRWSLADQAKQVDELSSNPPPIAVALSESVAVVAERQSALEQRRAAAQQQQDAAARSQQAAEEADALLKSLRGSIKAGEQNVPKLDQARKDAATRLTQAVNELRQAQQAHRQANNALKAKAGESNRVRKDHERSVNALNKAKLELERANKDAQEADRKAKEKPEDEGLAKRAADLANKAKEAKQNHEQHQATVDQRTEQLAAAEKKQDEAKVEQEAKALVVDQAQQMEQARKQERDEANKAYDQGRNDLNQAKQAVRPAEDKLKKAKETQANTKAAADEATATVSLAEQGLAQAQRTVAKWRSAELGLKIDSLRRQRDELRSNAQLLIAQRDHKAAEVGELELRLAKATHTLAEQTEQLKQQDQKVAEAKKYVGEIAKQVDPTKPETAEALEDAQFDLETAEHTAKKLREAIANQPAAVKAVKAEINQARAEQAELERLVTELPKDPGAKQQAEIDTLLPRYRSLRQAAGF